LPGAKRSLRSEEENVITKRREPTVEEIARKAYELSESAEPGSDEENWYRAEQELRAKPTTRPRKAKPVEQ
jgi:hypothetical protein